MTVARLATVTPTGAPHLVPVTFALLDDDTIVTAVDHKPKRTTALQRLRNIAHEPRVCLLADHYEDDWSMLWWVRADGRARVLAPPSGADDRALEPTDRALEPADRGPEPTDRTRAIAALSARYPEYDIRPPQGPVIAISVERLSGWSAQAASHRAPEGQ